MNEIGFLDLLSQGIPLIVTIVAIMGDTWDKSQKGLNKLTRTGRVVVGLIVFIGLPLSFYTMNESKKNLAENIDRHHIGAKEHKELNETLYATLIAADSLEEIIVDIQTSLFMELRAMGDSIKGTVQSTGEQIKISISDSLQRAIASSEGNLKTAITDSLQTIIKDAEGSLEIAITNSKDILKKTMTGAEGSLQIAITTSEGNLNSTMINTESNLRTAIKDSEGKLESAMKNANDHLKTEIEKILKSYIENLEIKLVKKLDSIK